MEIYKGTATFSGIAIGKILYYHRSDYQIRQYLVSDVKKELRDFNEARLQVIGQLRELYKKNDSRQERESKVFLEQARLLESGSFIRAVESMISSEKVNAAYAVMTNRDELASTFRKLEDSAIRERVFHIQEISNRLIAILGGDSPRIDLGEEPVILVAETLSPAEIMEMDKEKLLAVVTRQGSSVSHASIMAKTMEIPSLVDIETDDGWEGMQAIVDGYTGTLYLCPEREVRIRDQEKGRFRRT